ncbi:MAG: DNA phosphorothioation system sulfurtransferase DndC, partial [Thaumarchaeota archaeon]|nr:DNA phosphorothioation system sulfurtransferase DndC [Nitrososphaerota archaeon]
MTAESVFKSRTVKEIYDEIREVYLSDNRPWILGFSGGKDSTCMVQLVWHAISNLPEEKRQKKIYIISSDTLVESPKIVEQLTKTLDSMELAAKEQALLISTNLVRPLIKDSFWVCLLGLGYPAPSNNFRWCTDRLKIRNADRFINEKVSEYGEAIVVLGTRKDESGSRAQLMNLYEIEGSYLSRHSKYAQTYVYTPLRDFTTEDVWNYLLQNKNPWGGNNRDLLALYQNANAAECPLVVDTSTPSCGNSRFGCWVCTVVDRDKSMENLIDSGEDWMEPLLELRQELKDTQDPEKKLEIRDFKRRTGNVTFYTDGTEKITPGPYKIDWRKDFLKKLLVAQNSIRKNGPDPEMSLILEDELHEIQ